MQSYYYSKYRWVVYGRRTWTTNISDKLDGPFRSANFVRYTHLRSCGVYYAVAVDMPRRHGPHINVNRIHAHTNGPVIKLALNIRQKYTILIDCTINGKISSD